VYTNILMYGNVLIIYVLHLYAKRTYGEGVLGKVVPVLN
jgi:hypothetical protein